MTVTNYTTIDLLRHGEVQGGACYRGSLDDPLTELGWKQMLLATQKQQWDMIISSPLCRCAKFANFLSTQTKIHDDLKEIDFGDWEGKNYQQLNIEQPAALANFINDPENHPPPNAEPLSNFRCRVVKEWKHIITTYQDCHILLIAHGGTIRTIISHILNIPGKDMMRLEVAHGSISRIRLHYHNNKVFPSLVFHGKTIDE